MKKISFIVLFISILFSSASNTYAKNIYVKQITSDELQSTKITPILDAAITTNENLIFCSTFQISWNELCNKLKLETLEIENAPYYINQLNALNNQKPLLNDDSYFVLTGIGLKSILNDINNVLRKKIGYFNKNDLKQKLNFNQESHDIVAFSLFNKNIEFERPFYLQESSPMLFKDKAYNISMFGFHDSYYYSKHITEEHVKRELANNADNFSKSNHTNIPKYLLKKQFKAINNIIKSEFKNKSKYDSFYNQFYLLYYRSKEVDKKPDHVIINLLSKSCTDEIIISTLPIGKTLQESYDNIINAINTENRRDTSSVCSITIPKLNFNILTEYNELKNKKIINRNTENYLIKTIIQKIVFNLNVNGGISSQPVVWVSVGQPYYRPICISIECPFIIYLKEKSNKLPYFMAYIATPELLTENFNYEPPRYSEGKLDKEVEANPLLREITNSGLDSVEENMKYINVKSNDGSNTLLLSLQKRKFIEPKFINYRIRPDNRSYDLREMKEKYYFFIKRLIRYGADVNASNNSGLTPLICAVKNNDLNIVKLLVESGANINAKQNNHNALMIAKRRKYHDIYNYLSKISK